VLAFCALVGGTVVSVAWAMRADAEAAMATSVTTFVEELFSEAAPEIAQGRELSVRDLVLRGAKLVETGLSEQPLRRARLMRLLGSVLSAMGDGVTALPLAEQALELLERELSADDPRVLDATLTVAGCRYAQGDAAGAAPLFAEVLANHERAGRGADELFARCHEGLGACASVRGDLDAALHHYTVMQDARRDDPSPDVRGLADLLVHQANVQQVRGTCREAEALFERADALLRTADDPLQQATVATSLGNLRIAQGRVAEAERAVPPCAAARRTQLGPDHPMLIRRLCNLAGAPGAVRTPRRGGTAARAGGGARQRRGTVVSTRRRQRD
jgi:tetratricopeptide (TPR) repeat protein